MCSLLMLWSNSISVATALTCGVVFRFMTIFVHVSESVQKIWGSGLWRTRYVQQKCGSIDRSIHWSTDQWIGSNNNKIIIITINIIVYFVLCLVEKVLHTVSFLKQITIMLIFVQRKVSKALLINNVRLLAFVFTE